MKIVSIVLALVQLFCCAESYGQQKQATAKGWNFRSINTAGWLDGQSGAALQVLTINGLQHNTWFWGIGTGVDGYRLRSIPVFADVRKTIVGKVFVYADAGLNWHWQKNGEVKQFYADDKFKAGLYGEAGAGYALKLRGGVRLLLSGGYRLKKITETGNEFYDPGFPNTTPSSSKINYTLNSVVIKVGVSF